MISLIISFCFFAAISALSSADMQIIEAPKAYAPNVPPPIVRSSPAHLRLTLNTTIVKRKLNATHDYEFWAYDGHVPGPIIRTRVGDVLEVVFTNAENAGVEHDIDFHAVSGPGGGASVLIAQPGQTITATFRLVHPGLFVYHCGVQPAPYHLANGLYGLILVEPAEGLPKVDREFYVVKSEFYTKSDNTTLLQPAFDDGLDEKPSHIVFNGRLGALVSNPLETEANERVRVFFGNAGPNLPASYHIIGIIFDKVYREGDLISSPARSVQTTLVPAGGSAVVEFQTAVPGVYTMVDHSLFRILKGAIGQLKVTGTPRLDIYCPDKAGGNLTCKVDEKFDNEENFVTKQKLSDAGDSVTANFLIVLICFTVRRILQT